MYLGETEVNDDVLQSFYNATPPYGEALLSLLADMSEHSPMFSAAFEAFSRRLQADWDAQYQRELHNSTIANVAKDLAREFGVATEKWKEVISYNHGLMQKDMFNPISGFIVEVVWARARQMVASRDAMLVLRNGGREALLVELSNRMYSTRALELEYIRQTHVQDD